MTDTKKYDSIAEKQFHNRHPELLVTKDPYKCSFVDSSGTIFRAIPDFYDPQNSCYIEFKDGVLNTKPNKLSAIESSAKVQQYKADHNLNWTFKDAYTHDWNHSMFKQSIVQKRLSKKGVTMIVVFSDRSKLSQTNINRLAKCGLKWDYESNYFELQQETA
ncbi:hypothetical protein [Photobacterium phosphoreum]|uniref:hypothetical protein n=1 Tax=Photobacterium phosphoreum TaxID=659 RepID=UPI000D183C16|nr:hypothetical protein [Photobacterium phosphoreum]PSU32167.1 hypothetical protein CTM85_20220 [Photobacterium phosphoreum]